MDLKTILTRIDNGTLLAKDYGTTVVDIGDGMVVKFGHRVYPREAHVTAFVAAAQPSIPVPKIYAVATDTSNADHPVTYIVQEKIGGISLADALPALSKNPAMRDAITAQLADILQKLATLDTARTELGPYEGSFTGGTFDFGRRSTPLCLAEDTAGFVQFFLDVGIRGYNETKKDGWLKLFDMDRPHIFSHGDLVPVNILVDPNTGVVTGIIDWERAGWFPYFWNDKVMRYAWDLRNTPGREMVEKLLPLETKAVALAFSEIWFAGDIYGP